MINKLRLKYNRWKLIIQMKYNQELYQEYLNCKNHQPSPTYSLHYKRKNLLQLIVDLPTQSNIQLESSIPLLYHLGITSHLEIMEQLT